MFDRFTERSRKVMSLARKAAQDLNSEFIGTEHILIGIMEENGGVAAKALEKLNVDLKRVHEEIKKAVVPSTTPAVTLGQLPFAPRAKRVIELAGEAASMLGHDVIGTEHLLLGLLKENEGVAFKVLANLGIKTEEVRDMVLEVLGVEAVSEKPAAHNKPITAIVTLYEEVKDSEVGNSVRLFVHGFDKAGKNVTYQLEPQKKIQITSENLEDILDIVNYIASSHKSRVHSVDLRQ